MPSIFDWTPSILDRMPPVGYWLLAIGYSFMTFAYPEFLWLAVIVPAALLVFFWWSWRTRQKLMAQFIHTRLLPGLIVGMSPGREKFRAALFVAACIFLILALARPQWGYDLEEVKQRGLDVVVAIDTSKSMLAQDITPYRLARAKLAALDLMQQAKSDRLGLVAFAGTAFLQCPLTIDDVAFRQSVESLDVNTLPEGGTAIAEAIETALQAFKENDSHKVLVLFTDGEDHDSDALAAAKKAEDAGVIIFTIGIGSAEGELLRIRGADGQTDYVRDENGNVVKSHLDESLLQQIAGPSGKGFYLPLRGANTIDLLYQRGLAPLPKTESQEKWVKRPRERYQWPLALAVVLLIIEMLFPERKAPSAVQRNMNSSEKEPPVRRESVIAAAITILLLISAPAFASPATALREYRSGNYDDALKDYEHALQKKNDDPRLHFNAGAAAYRSGQFDQAAKHFGDTLNSPDLNLQEQAYYNLGNTLYHLGEQNSDSEKKSESWEQSLKKYESSLKLNPQDQDAKFNYEFVKKRLEELKQQQQQQQKQNNQNQKQDQKDQNQQQQQAKNDQQQKSDSQSQDRKKDSSQQQQQNQQKQKQDQQQANQSQEKKDQQQKNRQNATNSEQQKKDQDQASGEQQETKEYAPGEMTPQQAKQLLDAQKGNEKMLPVQPTQKPIARRGPVKDW
jgi:Ca-activated chloride channel family protein